jgi:transcriptional regulator with XRE-family HTH domain
MAGVDEIGVRIARIRKEKAISGEQLGLILGIGRATVSAMETGKSKPTVEGLAKILEAYPDLNAEWLILGKGEMHKNEDAETSANADCWGMLKAERVKTQTLEDILRKHGILKVD